MLAHSPETCLKWDCSPDFEKVSYPEVRKREYWLETQNETKVKILKLHFIANNQNNKM